MKVGHWNITEVIYLVQFNLERWGWIYRDVKDDVDKILKRLKENPVKLQQMAGVYEVNEGYAVNTANELPTDLF